MKPIYRRRDDNRAFNTYTQGQHFLDVIANRRETKELLEAKQRVIIENGRYQYVPSEEYKRTKAEFDLAKLRVRKSH